MDGVQEPVPMKELSWMGNGWSDMVLADRLSRSRCRLSCARECTRARMSEGTNGHNAFGETSYDTNSYKANILLAKPFDPTATARILCDGF